jgi:hypothetical protein
MTAGALVEVSGPKLDCPFPDKGTAIREVLTGEEDLGPALTDSTATPREAIPLLGA